MKTISWKHFEVKHLNRLLVVNYTKSGRPSLWIHVIQRHIVLLVLHSHEDMDDIWSCMSDVFPLRPEVCLLFSVGSSCTEVPADRSEVNWWSSTHKDVCPIICKAVVNDSSCEAGMHHFQADLSLTSHSRVLLIQIYLWQDALWAYIKRIRTPHGHSESCAKWKGTHEQKEGIFCCQITQLQVIYAYNISPGG